MVTIYKSELILYFKFTSLSAVRWALPRLLPIEVLMTSLFWLISLLWGCAVSLLHVQASLVATVWALQLWQMGSVAPWCAGSDFPTRGQTHVPCIGRWILCQWTTREVPTLLKQYQSSPMGQIQHNTRKEMETQKSLIKCRENFI